MSTSEQFEIRRVVANELYELRRRVLRNNDPDKEVRDDRDDQESAVHFGGFLNNTLVACGSFYPSTPPLNESLRTYQLRYLATDFSMQGRGFGRRLLEVAEEDLKALGAQQLWANGRDTALDFYLGTGWLAIEGSEHLSAVTQLPHTVIYKVFQA
jgi:GNAT superfamily N-acetyltransferase